MFERFTERARQVVVLAQEEARMLKHNHIGTEHLLLGLFREEQGIGCRALNALGLTVEECRAWVADGEPPEERSDGQIPFTERAQKVLELALREALSLGHNYIGTEHLLLGLVREHEGPAAEWFRDREVDSEHVRQEVYRLLSGGTRRAGGHTDNGDDDSEVKLTRREYAYLRDLVGREPVADERAYAAYEKLKVLATRAAL